LIIKWQLLNNIDFHEDPSPHILQLYLLGADHQMTIIEW